MDFEHTRTFNFEGAIRGMRNPLNSWHKSDSFAFQKSTGEERFVFGPKDKILAQKLIRAGSEHRKFMRQIFVSVDITAPLYFWKEFSTYKIGTTSNSCSTMHKLTDTEITKEHFERADLLKEDIIPYLEELRCLYNQTKDPEVWKKLIVNLPESWLQRRTVTLNYENLLSMIHQRKNHKLTEWSVDFMNWTKTLPYADELLFIGE